MDPSPGEDPGILGFPTKLSGRKLVPGLNETYGFLLSPEGLLPWTFGRHIGQ